MSNASIYIPRMSTKWTEAGVKNFMGELRIGTVSRVDFTPINKKPGFYENMNEDFMSAFVHFSDPYIYNDHYVFRFEMYMGNQSFWNEIENNRPYKLYTPIGVGEYWICLKNKNPIQRTLMNIHQVVENGRHLENLVTAEAEEIKNLKETVEFLSNKLEGVHQVVYQFVGGLYCQSTQSDMIDIHFKDLGFSRYKNATVEQDTHPSGIWPTTRQGDENRKRIEKLEEIISTLTSTEVNTSKKYDAEIKETNDSVGALQDLINGLYYQVQSIYHIENGIVCTEQGDKNRDRIEKLEERLRILEEDLNT